MLARVRNPLTSERSNTLRRAWCWASAAVVIGIVVRGSVSVSYLPVVQLENST